MRQKDGTGWPRQPVPGGTAQQEFLGAGMAVGTRDQQIGRRTIKVSVKGRSGRSAAGIHLVQGGATTFAPRAEGGVSTG